MPKCEAQHKKINYKNIFVNELRKSEHELLGNVKELKNKFMCVIMV